MTEKPRPSSLPNLEACPRWVGRLRDDASAPQDSMDQAADEGTLIHAKMEALAEVPVSGWDACIWGDPDLGPALAPVVTEAANQVRDIFSLGLPVVTKRRLGVSADAHYELGDLVAACDPSPPDGIYCEVGLDPGITKPGTGDLLAITGNRATYVDYKSNRVIRSHTAQIKAYVLGVFRAVPRVDYVEARIVAPRLGDAHAAVVYSRAGDLEVIETELRRIADDAADPFTAGCPGEPCAMCAGNGRCCWQAATLRDIPVEASALVTPGMWRTLMDPPSPEVRGQRKRLAKFMETFCEAVKKDDQSWAADNPAEALPGFTKSVQAGRASLDKTRLAEANAALRLRFGLAPDVLEAFCCVDRARLAEYVALGQGMTEADADAEIKRCLSPYMVRGNDIVSFRAVKPKRGELNK